MLVRSGAVFQSCIPSTAAQCTVASSTSRLHRLHRLRRLHRLHCCFADTNGCLGHPCSTTAQAVAGSCVDVAAPADNYTCSCNTGYTWQQGSLSCVGKDNLGVCVLHCSVVLKACGLLLPWQGVCQKEW
jgi:hypothetical protein